jgi:hypothetical protein
VSSALFSPAIGLDRAHVGDKGELWFASSLPPGWVWQPPRRDFGKDGLIVIRDRSKLHNIEFSVQIKATTRPIFHREDVIIAGVSRSSVRYWFASPLPTLVVLVDLSEGRAWYAWHLDLFQSPKELYESKKRTVTIKIPKKNTLDDLGWTFIRADLFRHFRGIQRALRNDYEFPRWLASVNNVARIASNLIRIAASAPPDPPFTERECLSLFIEQIEIRDLISTAGSLLSDVARDSDAHKQITFWLSGLQEIIGGAYPRLDALPEKDEVIPTDFELAIVPKKVLEARPKIVLAAVDLLRMITLPASG